jgi:hypothetical protein
VGDCAGVDVAVAPLVGSVAVSSGEESHGEGGEGDGGMTIQKLNSVSSSADLAFRFVEPNSVTRGGSCDVSDNHKPM